MIHMNKFCDRLREERERLGLNQTDFAELGGVKKLAQFNYEKGERYPDAGYLMAVAASGVDTQYLLSGERHVNESPIDGIKQAAESVFRMVQSGGVQVTAEQFSQMVVALLPSLTNIAPKREAGEQGESLRTKSVAKNIGGNAQVAQGSGIVQVGGKIRASHANKLKSN